MRIASVASAFPPHYYAQTTVTRMLEQVWSGRPEIERLAALHRNCGVEGRHFALPLERYFELDSFGRFNDEWIAVALELGERAVRLALARAGLVPTDVDLILFSTVTGLAVPSLDARLANRLGFRSDVRRMPLFGLGCVAGAAAVARAADFVRGRPNAVALVLTIELCSLTFQQDELSLPHLISTGLFGDGATCAVITGDARPASGPRIVDTRSVFYPNTEDAMGWKIGEHGFSLILSPAVPEIAREHLGVDVRALLADHALEPRDIGFWVCHPGGPKVLSAMCEALDLAAEDLALSREVLRTNGNLSSATVLLILERTLRDRRPAAGAKGVMLAMGPGFCSEILLLEAD